MSEPDDFAKWRKPIEQAWRGDPRWLLEMLIIPETTDGQGKPLTFVQLPHNSKQREEIVTVLMLGPWRQAGSVGELMTRTGWGRGKPKLSEREVSFAALFDATGGDVADMESNASSLGVEPETLRKRIQKYRRAKQSK